MATCVEVPATECVIVEVCTPGPAGTPGSVVVPAVAVAASATELFDSFSNNAAVRSIWFITGTDPTGLQYSKVVDAHWDQLGNTGRVVHSQYGQYPGFGVAVTDNAGTIELSVTNNHTLTITVRATRLDVL